jgi:hypothetical protein
MNTARVIQTFVYIYSYKQGNSSDLLCDIAQSGKYILVQLHIEFALISFKIANCSWSQMDTILSGGQLETGCNCVQGLLYLDNLGE